MCVALACDFRIAATEAKLGFPFVKLGIHPGLSPNPSFPLSTSSGIGASVLLPRLITPQQAFKYLLTGATVSGSAAREHGLVLEAVSKDDVLPRAISLAESLLVNAPIAVQTCVTSLRADKVRSHLTPSDPWCCGL
jgi:enoyl-CoA hydratase